MSEPFLVVQEDRYIAERECGCVLQAGYEFGYKADVMLCPLHAAAPALAEAAAKVDGLIGPTVEGTWEREASEALRAALALVEGGQDA